MTLLAVAVTAVAVTLLLRARRAATALFFSLVVAGAAGNLADRLVRAPGLGRGAVVDWVHFSGGGGSLNLSDLAINIGVLGAVIALAATRQPAREQAGTTAPGHGTVREERS